MMRPADRPASEPTAPRIVLASQSPRRRDLLTLIGVPHTARPADIDETVRPGESPLACVERLAREKADRIVSRETRAGDDLVVIAADTIVVIDARILNKPADRDDARAMLQALQGRTHEVHTAACVVRGPRQVAEVTTVEVHFRPMAGHEIDAYIATGEPMDKAGAYGIQGYGATIVDRIDGDFFAVMGLPLVSLVRLLAAVGLQYDFGRLSTSPSTPSPSPAPGRP